MKYLLLFLSSLLFVHASAEIHADSLLNAYLTSQGLPQYSAQSVDLYSNGTDKFDALFADIREAKESINIEYFIFANDSIGNALMNLLKDAAARGVKVRVVVDGFEDKSRKYDYRKRIEELENQGIELKVFDPFKPPYVNHVGRDHRKIVVIDDQIGYIGGLNVADYYIDGRPEFGGWRDMHMRVTGEAVKGLQDYFNNAYMISGGADLEVKDRDYYLQKADKKTVENTDIRITYFERSRANHAKKAETRRAFVEALNAAQDTLRIVSPYFLPTHSVRKALVKAIDRVNNVQILFSETGDNRYLSAGNKHLAKRLVRHGAEVYLYKGAFHHSKIMMIDGEISMVGSANMNSRSLRWDYEASCFVFDQETTAELNDIFEKDKLQCNKFTKEYYSKISLKNRIFGWLVDRLFTPML